MGVGKFDKTRRGLWEKVRVFPTENLVGGYSFTPPLRINSRGVKYAAILVGG